MNKTGESTLEVGRIGEILIRFITLGNVWDGRTREAGGDWSVLEGSVLGGGCCEIWPLVDWEAGGHLNGEGERLRWRKGRKKIWRSLPCQRPPGTKISQKAEFRSLPSSTDLSKKMPPKIQIYSVLLFTSKHKSNITATSQVSEI